MGEVSRLWRGFASCLIGCGGYISLERGPTLRAAADLARLWGERCERQKAAELLAPVYSWFTEGFETADLRDAKTLLDGLA